MKATHKTHAKQLLYNCLACALMGPHFERRCKDTKNQLLIQIFYTLFVIHAQFLYRFKHPRSLSIHVTLCSGPLSAKIGVRQKAHPRVDIVPDDAGVL